MRSVTCGFLTACAALAAGAAAAQDRPQAFVGARIIRIEGDEIPSGTLVIEKGKIVAVGPVADVKLPEGANKIDVAGRVIIAAPGDRELAVDPVDEIAVQLGPDRDSRDDRHDRQQAGDRDQQPRAQRKRHLRPLA